MYHNMQLSMQPMQSKTTHLNCSAFLYTYMKFNLRTSNFNTTPLMIE